MKSFLGKIMLQPSGLQHIDFANKGLFQRIPKDGTYAPDAEAGLPEQPIAYW